MREGRKRRCDGRLHGLGERFDEGVDMLGESSDAVRGDAVAEDLLALIKVAPRLHDGVESVAVLLLAPADGGHMLAVGNDGGAVSHEGSHDVEVGVSAVTHLLF